jgi:hypothetical protein
LSYEQLKEYSNAIARKGGVDGICRFIDGTMRAICRPMENQKLYYTGYKRLHTVKYQAILTPDGLISSLARPYLGTKDDWPMHQQSCIDTKLQDLLFIY